MKQLVEILRILGKLSTLEVPEGLEMFPDNIYGWLDKNRRNWSINEVLNEAIREGASHWFNHILENNSPEDKSDEACLQYLIKIVHLVRADLQKAIEFFDKLFQE